MQVNAYTIDEKLLLVVDNILTPEECSYFIKLLDTGESLEDVDRGFAFYKRNTLISHELSQLLYTRLEPLLTQIIKQPIVLNTHFRFSNYLPGQFFDIHTDGVNQDEKGRKSFMMIPTSHHNARWEQLPFQQIFLCWKGQLIYFK